MIKQFTKEYLLSKDLPYSAILETIIDTDRWSIIYEIIFEDEGKFYKAGYSTGATENQYEEPWEYEKIIDAVEVEQKEITTIQWVEVDG